MKWSETQVARLEEMCFAGVSNSDIAAELNCKVADVYSKRSQLGITIDKVRAAQPIKGIKPNKEFENSLPKKQQPQGLHPGVKKAFDNLHSALLIAMASDFVGMEETMVYKELSVIVNSLETSFNVLVGTCGCVNPNL